MAFLFLCNLRPRVSSSYVVELAGMLGPGLGGLRGVSD